jgi:hypothetical protein
LLTLLLPGGLSLNRGVFSAFLKHQQVVSVH